MTDPCPPNGSQSPVIDPQQLSLLSDLLGKTEFETLLQRVDCQLLQVNAQLALPIDAKTLELLCHRLKGSIGTVGFLRLSEASARLEACCQRGEETDDDVGRLRKLVEASRRALADWKVLRRCNS